MNNARLPNQRLGFESVTLNEVLRNYALSTIWLIFSALPPTYAVIYSENMLFIWEHFSHVSAVFKDLFFVFLL